MNNLYTAVKKNMEIGELGLVLESNLSFFYYCGFDESNPKRSFRILI